MCLFVLVKLLLCLPCLFHLIIYAKSDCVCDFFALYIFSCLLILKMCKLGAKTCYDYYWWVYLFKGVFSLLFSNWFFIYPTLWSVSFYMSMCALIDSVCFLMSVLLVSSRLEACINFLFSVCQLLLPCSFGFVYVVDLMLTYCTGNKHSFHHC